MAGQSAEPPESPQVYGADRLHWSLGEWQTGQDTASTPTALGIEYVDIPIPAGQRAPLRFTFFWPSSGRWEGRDYEVAVEP